MKIYALLFVSVLTFVSCGSNKNLTDRSKVVEESSKKVIKNHYSNTFSKKTMSADMKIGFDNGSKSQNLSVKLKMQKDETIWLSGTFFGIPVAKAIITPTRVSYYVKPMKTYFDGDFSTLSNLLGTELNYQMVQNLLLGDAMFELKASEYDSSLDQQAHLLTPKDLQALYAIFFWINPLNYKIERQEIKGENRFLSIEYPNYTTVSGTAIPQQIKIAAKTATSNAKIQMELSEIQLNEKLSFPYSIPSDYTRITK